MTKNFTLNATAASLLGFLHEGPMTGWDVVRVASDRIGNFWNLTRSQVYRELQSLADAGLITSSERGARDKRTFSVTPAGKTAFSEWLQQEPAEEIIRYPLLLTTSFASHLPPGALREFVAKHRSVHEARLQKYKQDRDKLAQDGATRTDGQLMTFAFGISYEEMVLAWMDEVLRAHDGQ